MKRNLSLAVLVWLILCAASFAQNQSEGEVKPTIEEGIARHALAFGNNSTFPFFDELSKTRQVIILGEEGHYDLTTSEVKINMINYLQTKGFNSVAFEVAPFLSTYVFSNPEYKDLTRNWKFEHILNFPPWLQQKSCQPLFKMINDRKIKVLGADTYFHRNDILAAEAIINKYSAEEERLVRVNWDRLEALMPEFMNGHIEALSIEEQFEMMRIIDDISNYTQYLISQKGELVDLKAVLQWVRNMNTVFSFIKYWGDGTTEYAMFVSRNRDSQMAENINWLAENFPQEQFTVWCANFHAAKDISQTQYPSDSLRYFVFQAMGEGVFNKLGSKMYSLAVTSLNNDMGKMMEETGTLELEIAKLLPNTPFAFIDFEPLRFTKDYFNKEFDCNVIMKKKGRWLQLFDGVYYIRDQKKDKDGLVLINLGP